MKGKSLRPKLASVFTTALISGLLVSIPVPANAAACSPSSNETNDGVTILTFATVGSCDWTVPPGITQAQVLIVAGGGGGGDSKIDATGGGGGAGGYFQSNVGISGSIAISVGAGGAGGANDTAATSTSRGTAGGDSSFGTLKVGGGGGGNSWNYTLDTAALSGNGGSSYLTGGNGGGARSRPNTSTATQNGGSGGAYSSSGIVFLGATFTGTAGIAGNNSNVGDAGTGGKGGSVISADRTSTISGSSYEYSKSGEFKWPAGAQTYGSGGDANYLGATNGVGGGAGSQGVVIVKYSIPVITVTYDVTGGSAPTPASQTQSTSGQSLTLATYSGLKGTKRFMNWNTAANGTGTNYKAGTAYTPRTNLTLYAIWMDAYCPEGWTWSEPTCTKSYSGQNNFIVPWGFNSLDVIAIGGSGANGAKGAGGAGGKIQASYSFTQGDEILFFPGGVGSGTNGGSDTYPNENYNGGNGLTNNGGSGGGGAATVVTKNGTSTSSIIIVAGGGGGGGARSGCGSQYNTESADGQTTVSSNSFTYGSPGINHGMNRFSGGGGGGTNGGNGGTATPAYSCSSGNDQGGHGRGGFRGGNTATDATTIVTNGANSVNGVSGSVTLQLTRPVINYNLNGATGTAPAKQVQSSEGEDLIVAAVGVTRAGFTFGGWYTAANATGTRYAPSDLYNTNAVLNLYAKWTSTITFSGNSSTGGTVPATITVLGTNATVLPTNTGTLARTNFLFDGWNTSANGSGTHYATGASYTTTGDVTLYARWNSTITYNGNGNTGGTAPTATTAKGTAANTTLASKGTLDRSNFNFSGWNTLANGTGTFYAAGATNYQSTGNVTLYAQWTATTGTPTLDSGSDTGNSATDKLTKDNTPTINVGALVPGATVTITATPATGTPVTCTFTASAAVSPATTSSGSCTFTTLTDGTYSFTVSQSYNGGASTVSTALTGVVIDTVRPTVTLSSASILSGGNSLATPAAPSQNYNINAIFSKTVSGFVIGEITKNAESTGWEITTTALSTSALSTYTFNVRNSTGAGNAAGKLFLSIAEGVATDSAGNTNAATTSSFIINTVIQLTLTNQYQAGINPVVGGNNATVVQSSNGASVDLTGQGGVTRANHTFAGWSLTRTANGSDTVIPSPFIPTVPLFLYSSWVANVYVVSYNANGGNGAPATASQNFSFGGTALVPSARGTLTRTGYTFDGWSTTPVASGTIYSNPNDTVSGTTTKTYTPAASITLFAKWTAGTFAVTFDANSGTGTAIANMSITAGTAKALTANTYTRAGYTFGGWNTLANGTGTAYANSATVTLFGNTTIYAQWVLVKPGAPSVSAASAGNTTATVTVTGAAVSGTTAGPATSYSIQTYANDGTTVITGKSCTVLATASPLSCEITGLTNGTTYKFLATAINTTGSTAGLISTVTAIPAPFVVTYSLNGGTLTPTTANFNLGSPLTLPLPTRSGYTFTGWNNPSGTSVGLNGGTYSPPATITLTAQWSAIVYTITYNGNGNTAGAAPSAGSFSTGGNSHSISTAGNLVKTGFAFDGWTTGSNGSGTAYAAGAGYSTSANLVLYAKWTPEVYTITYNVNGAGGAPSRATDTFTFGSTAITLPAVTGMIYANYTFGGWSETSTGAAVISPYSPTQSRTLYALWTGIQYSVSYNVNGGTGSVAEAVYTTGATGLTLSDGTGLTRTGYNFGGWKNLAGTTVSGAAYVATENVTLYAIWTPISVGISFNAGLVAGTAPTVTLPANTTAQFSTLFTLPASLSSVTDNATPAATYVFAGWEFAGNIYQAGSTYRMTTSAPVFTAQWQKLLAVRYVLNGGTLAAGDFVHDTQCTFEQVGFQCGGTNLVINLNKRPVRTGFTFTGWSSQGTPATLVAEEASYTLNDTNFIFYANWTPNSYRITYAVGTGATSSAAAAQTGNFGDIVTLASGTNYTLSGSIFSGWLISSNLAAGALYTLGTDAGTLTAGTYELTATAQYVNNTFKVFYNTNGSTAGNAPAATVAASGAAINLNDATGFSRSGFTFEGWSDGTTNLAAGFATTMGSANSTLIAQWKVAIPVTPIISAVSGSDGGATVTVAAGSGGGAPASYTVTSSPTGGSCIIPATATSCSISPLTNGTAYTFNVTATNSTGTSAAATSSAITPAGKPDAPTGVTATTGNASATVSFVAPASTGGPAITGYTITSSPAGATCTVGANATTYSCTGLTNGTAYTFSVTANNGIATSNASASSLAVTPATVPSAPTSVTATSSASGVATVSFSAPASNGSAITGYTVTSSPAGASCTVTANATTYSCSGLTDGTAYTFSVVATNSIGNSLGGVSGSVTSQGAASAPTTISAVSGDGKATVTFSGAVTNGSTITSYTVKAYDSTGNEVSDASCTVTTASTSPVSCEVNGLTNGSSYTFRAITNSTANGSSVSSAVSIPTSAITPAKAPDAPTGITTTAGTGKVTVGWTKPADNGSPITSYTVTSSPGGFTCTVLAPATTCDVSTGLVAGTAYTFTVTATSVAGTSSASTASTSASINAAPSEPRNVTAVKGNTTATVSWDAPLDSRGSDVTGYTATAYTSGNVSAGTCTTVAPIETCEITGLTNGTPYTFKVTASNAIGTSAQSTASSAVTPSTVPNAPTGITVASGDAQVTVSFTAPTNNGGSSVTGYTVTASNGSTISGTTSPLIITELTNGTAYTFTVKATNVNGDSVASSASASATPLASSAPVLVTPGQPTGNPYVGSTLTSNVTFSGSPTPTQTYQWKVCESATDSSSCTNISGATTATYVPTISELGKYIVVAATATNRVDSLTETSNPTLVIQPEIDFVAPSPVPGATARTTYVLSLAAAGGVGAFAYTISNGSLPAGLTLDPATGQLAGTPTTAGSFTFTVRATDSNGVFKDVAVTIVVAAAAVTPTPTPTPTTPAETCDSACQDVRTAAASKAAADRAAAEAISKAAADKAAADAAAAAKATSDAAATTASTKASADAAAAAAAAKAAVERAAEAAAAKAAADKASADAAARAKAATDAQAAANKAAADAQAALRNSAASAAAKAAATASAQKAAAAAQAAVRAAATAAQQAAIAKNTAANANKQVDIAINSLNSRTAASQASEQANAIATAAKAAANEAAAAAETRAAEARAAATAAQRTASTTAARIATEQKEAATAAALAKIAADAAAKATAEKIATANAAKAASEALLKVLEEKAALAQQAAKTSDQTVRSEIAKKLDAIEVKVVEAEKIAEEAATDAEEAIEEYEEAIDEAAEATEIAETQAEEAIAVKAESASRNAAASKAAADATVAAKVATAARAAAARVPSKAVISKKPATSSKNSATATVTGLKPGQKVKVTVNVKPKP
jgi:large repetitive protein